VKKYILVVGWVFVIVVLSLLPKSSIDTGSLKLFKGADKIVHFGMYAILMFLWMIAIKKNTKPNRNNRVLYAVIFSVVLGIMLELMQKYLVIGRSFDTFDIIANITGVTFVIIFLNNKIFKDEF